MSGTVAVFFFFFNLANYLETENAPTFAPGDL